MVTMAQSAANWHNMHTHVDRTHSLTSTVTTTWYKAPAQLLFFSACWVFLCFRNPPNSDMDYRIFIVHIWSFVCMNVHMTNAMREGVTWNLNSQTLTKDPTLNHQRPLYIPHVYIETFFLIEGNDRWPSLNQDITKSFTYSTVKELNCHTNQTRPSFYLIIPPPTLFFSLAHSLRLREPQSVRTVNIDSGC